MSSESDLECRGFRWELFLCLLLQPQLGLRFRSWPKVSLCFRSRPKVSLRFRSRPKVGLHFRPRRNCTPWLKSVFERRPRKNKPGFADTVSAAAIAKMRVNILLNCMVVLKRLVTSSGIVIGLYIPSLLDALISCAGNFWKDAQNMRMIWLDFVEENRPTGMHGCSSVWGLLLMIGVHIWQLQLDMFWCSDVLLDYRAVLVIVHWCTPEQRTQNTSSQ